MSLGNLEGMITNREHEDVLIRATRRIVDDPGNPGDHLVANMEALERNAMIQSNNSVRGAMFEHCFLDILLHWVPLSRVTRNIHVNEQLNVEVDFLVRPVNGGLPYLWFLKTSLRERWKQIDRDAILSKEKYSGDGVRIWTVGLFMRENKKHAPSWNRQKATTIHTQCRAVDYFLTAYDNDSMVSLFKAMKKS